jgi:predicted YcjX-like family ATPase
MYIIAVNAATRVTVVILLKEKKHTLAKMITLAKQIKLQTGEYPREWLLDGGKEFNQFKTWAEEEGITFKITPPRTSEPNGPSE